MITDVSSVQTVPLQKIQRNKAPDERAGAVRYAVLQRLAPAMRHHMVVNLQPIGMIYELMEHRVSHQRGDVHELHEGACKISRFAKAALSSCVDVMTWLERDMSAMTSVAEGVGESVALLGRPFGFMGFKLVNEVKNSDCRVPRDAIRYTLTSALLAAVDCAEVPADVLLQSKLGERDLAISVTVIECPHERIKQPFEESYRRLDWDDVEAVANAESVGFARHQEGATLFFPL